MKSTEKVDELRRVLARAVARADADPSLAMLVGAWAFLPGFMRRKILDALPLHVLADDVALDELLGLIAGVALELRTDDAETGDDMTLVVVASLRGQAHELLEQVRALA